ncbi:MAG TPA: LysE family translocator [Candidatus Deferrimicrobiaceae bacterium]|jgi:threonine/homoserine/homoserine lactone efflux protein
MLVFLSAGVVMGLSAGVSPGPLFALIVSQSVRHGAREGMKVAIVPALTDVPIILASTFLLSRIGDFKPALGAVSVAGALLLCMLAYESFRSAPPGLEVAADEPHSVRKGVLVNILSPHPYLFWVTVGAPMILKGWAKGPSFALAFVLGLYLCLVCSQLVLAQVAARSRRLLNGKGYVRLMRLLGVFLAAFALMLLRDGLGLLGLL